MTTLRITKATREALNDYAEEHELTQSEAVREILPDEEVSHGSSVMIDLDDDVYEDLQAHTGPGMTLDDLLWYQLITEGGRVPTEYPAESSNE